MAAPGGNGEMLRPVVYDVSHIVSRMGVSAITGIDCVDVAFGRHFSAVSGLQALASFCRGNSPYIMDQAALRKIVERSLADGCSSVLGDNFIRIWKWLGGRIPQADRKRPGAELRISRQLEAKFWDFKYRFAPKRCAVPPSAIYLNIAEHWFEHHEYFEWLNRRPDVQAVFFVHDLLPFDYPEYFRPGYDNVFQRRFQTIENHGSAFIVSTNTVRDRLMKALCNKRRHSPIYVSPLPSPSAVDDEVVPDIPPPAEPYFLLLSTIEPRKNHLLILNIWRELAAQFQKRTPKLALIGGPGWENEQVLDVFERCESTKQHIRWSTKVSRLELSWLITHAQALLMPSFDEGYGLPIVEALSLGTPVVASDIATFREVTGGCAILLSPLDGIAWRKTITALSDRRSEAWLAAKARAELFQKPSWENYFHGISDFLRSL